MKFKLTDNQVWVIEEMKRQGANFLAAVTQENWEEGLTYYMDKRVQLKGIWKKFRQGNKEAMMAKEGC